MKKRDRSQRYETRKHPITADFGLAVRGGTESKRIQEFACKQIYTDLEVSMDLTSDLILIFTKIYQLS